MLDLRVFCGFFLSSIATYGLKIFQKSYYKITSLIIALTFLLPGLIYADAWIPRAGQYKISSSAIFLDKESKKLRAISYQHYLKLQQYLQDLFDIRHKIGRQASLSELDKIKIEMLDEAVEFR